MAKETVSGQNRGKDLYRACLAGKPVKKRGERSRFLSGRRKARQVTVSGAHKRVSGNVGKSRNASTGFKVVKLYDGFTLVEAYPKTGRMHQIRVHFKHIGHPVAGDKTYASRSVLSTLPLPRHFLHAGGLSFPLPDGTKASFSSRCRKICRGVFTGFARHNLANKPLFQYSRMAK